MLSIKSLPWRSLKHYAGRTCALILISALTAAAVFGGTMLIGGVRRGLETVQKRLGADLMVIPESAEYDFDAQTVLIKAEPGYFFMDASVYEEIRETEGVGEASPQLFLTSARAGCCSVRVQMIAFDPTTDFTVQPWIEDTIPAGGIGLMDVVVGSNVDWASAADQGILRFYDCECSVIGQFAPTGSSLDNAVYMNFDTCRELIRACREKGMLKYESIDADKVISAVLIRLSPGADAGEVSARILGKVKGINVISSTNMVSGIAESLNGISNTVVKMIAVVWLLGAAMTALVIIMMLNERKREFASLRVMGASGRIICGIAEKEVLFVSLSGCAIGIFCAGVVLYSFGPLIGERLAAGFLLPSPGMALMAAAGAVLCCLLSAVPAEVITVKKLNSMDAGLVLKEGE